MDNKTNKKDLIKLSIAAFHAAAGISQYLKQKQKEEETLKAKSGRVFQAAGEKASGVWQDTHDKAYDLEGNLPKYLQRPSRKAADAHRQTGLIIGLMLSIAALAGTVAYFIRQRPPLMPGPIEKAKEQLDQGHIVSAATTALEQGAKTAEAGVKAKIDGAKSGAEDMKLAASQAASVAIEEKIIAPVKKKAIKIGAIALGALTLYIFLLALVAAVIANTVN